MTKWQKKLSAKQRKHLKETVAPGTAVTLAKFKRQRAWQVANAVVCWECESIARTLGIEE